MQRESYTPAKILRSRSMTIFSDVYLGRQYIFDEAFAIGANTEKYIDLAKRIKTDMKDPFYSEANQAILTESIAQLNRTIGRKK